MTRYDDLADYRRSVAALYARVRETTLDSAETCRRFRQERDHLFRTHPQSALSDRQKAAFTGLDYFDYDPRWRFELPVDPDVEPKTLTMDLNDDGQVRMEAFGQVHVPIGEQVYPLTLFWVLGYGGGIFLYFRDETRRTETYGAGRYLLDTIKLADLGQQAGKMVVDFNYAYNPSCAYNVRWHCPLLTSINQIPTPIPAGERRFADFE